MEAFSTHTGIAVPLRRSNVDTDQIIPAVYLKRITRTGFEDGLFAAWRRDPEFILNQEPYKHGSVLIVGPDFGTGSSREHAVWALQNYGFRVVIGSRFGDIFRSNSGKAGLLIATLSQHEVEQLWDLVDSEPNEKVTVDLADCTITRNGRQWQFAIDEFTRSRLLAGMDDIAATLAHTNEISSFEKRRSDILPRTLPVRIAE